MSCPSIGRSIVCGTVTQAEEITASQLGIPESQVAEIVRIAQTRISENNKAYASMTRKGAVGYMAFGSAMLTGAWLLGQGDVPLLRHGTLMIGSLLGAASVCWGLFRFFNHNPRYEF